MDKKEIEKRIKELNKEKYKKLSKEGLDIRYIWRWYKNKETPDNWLSATPVKILSLLSGGKSK